MKIVFAHTDFRVYWPGRLKSLNDYLVDRGHEFYVIEIAGKGSPYDFFDKEGTLPSFWNCLFPEKRMEDISSARANTALRIKLDEIDPDIVFSGAIAYSSGAASIRWALENNKRCIVFDNARLKDVPRNFIINFIKRKIYAGVDAIFCPAPDWNETFNYFGFTDSRIFYGLNVVNNDYWSVDSSEVTVTLPDKFFLAVGRQILKKNFLLLLKAYFDYSNSVKEPAHLVLVGNGPRRSILESYKKEKNLHKVIFLSFTNQEALRCIYKKAMALILPSRYGETWGLVINEAMASGLPVLVSTQVGCSSTLVHEGENGYTFSPYDVYHLAYLLRIINNFSEKQRAEMGQKSRQIIKNWGYERFCIGINDAISYVITHEKIRPGILSRILIRMWKGRYRPL
jgi:1,2-diacylglycerol 3-alpha-glucosyltransferase